MNSKKVVLSFIIGLVFSAFALFFTFRNIPLEELMLYLRSINYWWTIPSILIAVVSILLRVVRWQIILRPIKLTGFWQSFHPLMVGFMFNYILPGRVGELARPAIFSRRENISFSGALATVGAERAFDVITLLVLSIVMMTTVAIDPDLDLEFGSYHLNKATFEVIWITTVKVCVLLLLAIVMIGIGKTREFIKGIIRRIPGFFLFLKPGSRARVRDRFFEPLNRVIDSIASGFEIIKNPLHSLVCLIISFAVWITGALSLYVMAFGCPGIDISFLEMCAVLIIVCFFISLPSVPGFWGLFEAGGVFGLMVFGVAGKEAAGFILTNHVIQMLPVILTGVVSSTIVGVSFANGYSNEDIKREGAESLETDQV